MRTHNFNAGPAALPLPVLERAQRELLDYEGTGMSIMEHSHRGKAYDALHNDTKERMRRVLGIPDSHLVLMLQGGASLQFAMIPMNFVGEGQSADYVVTGSWAKKALGEAKRVKKARAAADMHEGGVCTRIPAQAELELDRDAAYVHITSNNTIFGTQWHSWPETHGVPLIADMSSDFMWRPTDVARFDMIYAGAQKNVGPSGLAILILRKSFLERAAKGLPDILSLSVHADNDGLFHTPNTFGVYMTRAVLEHVEGLGGLPAMEKANRDKAQLLYDAIDADPDFFRAGVEKASRSTMNVVWNLPTEALEARFASESAKHGLVGLKGHRSVGGMRASIYNACPKESVQALVDFMHAFRKTA